MLALFRAQPRGFRMLFLLEMWERFGYYTMQGVLTLFFIRSLGFSDDVAYYTFGAFFALVYGMVSLGGYLGDHVLGAKRTIVLGLITLALGYLALALSNKQHVFYALGLICVGNGLFKANPANLLSKCYDDADPRLHGGFTLYYMSINLGSIIALFVGPSLSATLGYSYAYFASFIGIVLGLVNYWFQRERVRRVNTLADTYTVSYWVWGGILFGIGLATVISAYLLQHVKLAEMLLWVAMAAVVSIYGYILLQEKAPSRKRMLLALILMLEAITFFTLYQQMPTSLNLFAVNNVHAYLFGIPIDPQSFQALNPIWIVVLSPVVAAVYAAMQRKGILCPIPYKFAFGMFSCGMSFIVLFLSRYWQDQGIVSSWWLVGSYCFQSIGELLVSALGVAMVAELVPKKMTGFVMGIWFLTSSAAGFTGAFVASYTALPKHLEPGIESLMIYTRVFGYIGLVTLGVAVFMWLMSPHLARLMSLPSRDSTVAK